MNSHVPVITPVYGDEEKGESKVRYQMTEYFDEGLQENMQYNVIFS